MKNKVFVIIFILFFIFTSSVLAMNTSSQQLEIHSDIYEAKEDSYLLDGKVSGNVFTCSSDFEMSDTSTVSGNLYIVADNVYLKSNVTYSNAFSKDDSYSIESVNSHATVDGNVFVICNEFILEPGAEIIGDLYIVAQKIDIQKSASIYGNLFAVSPEILLNGRVSNSVYSTCDNFNMNYYGAIGNDLHITSENATLSSVIHRNAYINSKSITTNTDFLLYGNLEADSHEFNFSGEIDGNAKINSKKINFINHKDDEKIKCLISGNLNYSSNEEIQIENNIINGEVTYSSYVEKLNTKPTFSFKSFIVDLITFVIYVFIIALIFILLNKNYKNIKQEIDIKTTLASFGIGILSFIAVAIIAFVLIIIPFGITLALALIFTYLFLLFVAIPIFILDIATLLKDKFNLYLSTVLIALGLYIISNIPVLGGLIMFVALMTGVGRIFKKL